MDTPKTTSRFAYVQLETGDQVAIKALLGLTIAEWEQRYGKRVTHVGYGGRYVPVNEVTNG